MILGCRLLDFCVCVFWAIWVDLMCAFGLTGANLLGRPTRAQWDARRRRASRRALRHYGLIFRWGRFDSAQLVNLSAKSQSNSHALMAAASLRPCTSFEATNHNSPSSRHDGCHPGIRYNPGTTHSSDCAEPSPISTAATDQTVHNLLNYFTHSLACLLGDLQLPPQAPDVCEYISSHVGKA